MQNEDKSRACLPIIQFCQKAQFLALNIKIQKAKVGLEMPKESDKKY